MLCPVPVLSILQGLQLIAATNSVAQVENSVLQWRVHGQGHVESSALVRKESKGAISLEPSLSLEVQVASSSELKSLQQRNGATARQSDKGLETAGVDNSDGSDTVSRDDALTAILGHEPDSKMAHASQTLMKKLPAVLVEDEVLKELDAEMTFGHRRRRRRRAKPCVMNDWGSWGSCSKVCDGGTKYRSRTVQSPAQHGGLACGASTDSTSCNSQECCVWSSWSAWDACVPACGPGKQNRSQSHNGHCTGEKKEERTCELKKCPVDCTWNDWELWGDCDKTCDGGTQSRNRVKNVQEAHGGKCDGEPTEEQACNEDACPTTTTTTTTLFVMPVLKSGGNQVTHGSCFVLLLALAFTTG